MYTNQNWLAIVQAIFFPGLSSHFCLIFAHLLWFGAWGLELGWGFQLMGFWAYGVMLSGVFGVGTLYVNIQE